MDCKTCGNKIKEDSIFCNYCGNEISGGENKERTSKGEIKSKLNIKIRNNTNKKISSKKFAIFLGIILCGVTLLFIIVQGNNKEFVNAIRNNNMVEAKKVFAEMKKEKDIEKIKVFLIEEVERVRDNYIKNKISAEVATKYLEDIRELNIISTEPKESIEYIKKIDKSKEAYTRLENYMGKAQYKDAIMESEKIIEEDSNYNSAIEYKKQAKSKLEDELIKESKGLALENNFAEAVDLLDLNKKYLDNSTVLESLIHEYKKEAGKLLISQAQNMLANGEYSSALKLLSDNSKYSVDKNIVNEIDKIKELKKDADKKEILEIKQRLKVDYDSVENEYKIGPIGNSTRYVNVDRTTNIEPRIIYSNSPTLALVVGFHQEDWIFFEKVIFVTDNSRFEWELDYFDRKSQVGNGIAEWYTVVHSDFLAGIQSNVKNVSSLINELITSKTATIRFQGNGYRDHTVTEKEKQSLKDLWNLYNLLNEYPEFFQLLK